MKGPPDDTLHMAYNCLIKCNDHARPQIPLILPFRATYLIELCCFTGANRVEADRQTSRTLIVSSLNKKWPYLFVTLLTDIFGTSFVRGTPLTVSQADPIESSGWQDSWEFGQNVVELQGVGGLWVALSPTCKVVIGIQWQVPYILKDSL